MSTRSDFGVLLRRLREEKGYTQRELARRAGLDSGYYSRAENGTIPISDAAGLRIAYVLGESPCKLLAAANKLRRRFPYDAVSPSARRSFRKVGEGKRLTAQDKDFLFHVYWAWHNGPEEQGDWGGHTRAKRETQTRRGATRTAETGQGDEDPGAVKRVAPSSRPGLAPGNAGASRPPTQRYWEEFSEPRAQVARRRAVGRQCEEDEAREVLLEYAWRYGPLETLQTPIDLIASRLCGLTVREGDVQHHGQGTSGVLLPREGEIWVSDQIREEARQRFTIGHEIWHFYHWWTVDGPPITPHAESRADRFSASLLMPEPCIRTVVCRWELKDPVYRYALAKAYGVSVRALEWRLVSFGLVSPRTLHLTDMPVRRRARNYRREQFPWLM